MKKSEARLHELLSTFRARDGRVTPQRMAILKALLAADHPTIQEIDVVVKQNFPMTSLVTVYRTISLLRDAGMVLEVDPGGPLAHYDGLRPNHHPHLVCLECGRVVDSPDLDVQALITDLGDRADNWTLSEELHIYGQCPDCQAKAVPGVLKGGEELTQVAEASHVEP